MHVSGSNISNPTMRTGLDFKSAQFDPSHLTGSNCKDLKSSPVRIGGFGITFQTNEYFILSSPWTELILIQS